MAAVTGGLVQALPMAAYDQVQEHSYPLMNMDHIQFPWNRIPTKHFFIILKQIFVYVQTQICFNSINIKIFFYYGKFQMYSKVDRLIQ